MSLTDGLLNDIEKLGFRENQYFQAGWSTGRLDLVYRLATATTEDEITEILEAARKEARQIAEDGIRQAMKDMMARFDLTLEDDSE